MKKIITTIGILYKKDKKRRVDINTTFEGKLSSTFVAINHFSYLDTLHYLKQLRLVLNEKQASFEWNLNGNRINFVSFSDSTIIEDYIFSENMGLKIKTSEVIKLLESRSRLLESLNENHVKRILTEGFTEIEQKPKSYKIETNVYQTYHPELDIYLRYRMNMRQIKSGVEKLLSSLVIDNRLFKDDNISNI